MEGYGQNINGSELYFNYDPSKSYTAGEKFVWQSPHGDWRTYIVRNGQTLNAGETPFTNPEKVDWISEKKFPKRMLAFTENAASMNYRAMAVGNGKIATVRTGTQSFLLNNNDITTNQIFTRVSSNYNNNFTATTGPCGLVYIGFLNEFWLWQSGDTNGDRIARYDANTGAYISMLQPEPGRRVNQIQVSEVDQRIFILWDNTNIVTSQFIWGWYDNSLNFTNNLTTQSNNGSTAIWSYYSPRYNRIYFPNGNNNLNTINCNDLTITNYGTIGFGLGLTQTYIGVAEGQNDPNIAYLYGYTSQGVVTLDSNGVPINISNVRLARGRNFINSSSYYPVCIPEYKSIVFYSRQSSSTNQFLYLDIFNYETLKFETIELNIGLNISSNVHTMPMVYDSANKILFVGRQATIATSAYECYVEAFYV